MFSPAVDMLAVAARLREPDDSALFAPLRQRCDCHATDVVMLCYDD